jgi:hypothetical protein
MWRPVRAPTGHCSKLDFESLLGVVAGAVNPGLGLDLEGELCWHGEVSSLETRERVLETATLDGRSAAARVSAPPQERTPRRTRGILPVQAAGRAADHRDTRLVCQCREPGSRTSQSGRADPASLEYERAGQRRSQVRSVPPQAGEHWGARPDKLTRSYYSMGSIWLISRLIR